MKKSSIIILAILLALCASCTLDPAEAPTIHTLGGIVEYNTPVEITTTVKNAQIRYTTDGTDPTYESTLYESSVRLVKNSVLKAAAFKSKKIVSEIATAEYTVKTAKPTANVSAGAYGVAYGSTDGIVLSCDTEGADIYYTLDGSDPVTSSTREKYSQAIVFPMSIPVQKVLRMYATSQGNVDSDINTATYTVYFNGPAGGYVFYDCDADNDATNDGAGPDKLKSTTCGWRYLEAAPVDISVDTTTTFVFAFYRTSDNGINWYVNGSATYVEGTSDPDDGKSTGTAIGTGKANTEKLVEKMGSAAYSSYSGNSTTANYAAKLCDDYTYGGYSDWSLPSKDELNLMYTNLQANGLGGFSSSYWSSSEGNGYGYAYDAWCQYFPNGSQYNNYRDNEYWVRAVRSFMILPSTN